MINKYGRVAIASVLGMSMLFMPVEASALTIPAPQRDMSTVITQKNNLLQTVQAERRRWLLRRQNRGVENRWRGSRWSSSRFRDGRWNGYRSTPRYRSGRYYRYGGSSRWYHRNRWDRGPGWALAIPFAFAGGALLGSAYNSGNYGRYGGSAHVRWCASRYRSYNPTTNTWVGYSGRVYQCRSPY